MKQIYLDNAATTPLDSEVLEEMADFMKREFGNPSSVHSFGRRTKAKIEETRKLIAHLLHVTPGEIIFTSGGTEADNMAITCSVNDLGVTRIITSEIEHHAVLHTVEKLANNKEIIIEFVQLDSAGNVKLDHLEELLKNSDQKTLVSLMHANNEIGNILPIEKVGALCRTYKAYFHSDTVQSIGHYPLDLSSIEIDFITGAAHKFHGPKGVGFLYLNKNLKIKPLISGGPQERNLRAGTENLYGIVGMGKAIEIAYRDMNTHRNHIVTLKQYMIDGLKENIKDVEFYGNIGEEGLYTVLNVNFPANDNAEMLLFSLDLAGVAASGGSACASGSNKGSHVLNVVSDDRERVAVRFSFSKLNTKEEIDYCIDKLKEVLS